MTVDIMGNIEQDESFKYILNFVGQHFLEKWFGCGEQEP